MGTMTDAQILAGVLDGTISEDEAYTEDTGSEALEQEAEAVVESQGDDDKAGETGEQATQKQDADTTDKEVEGAPIQSKSGAYTIPYQKLVDARAERDALREKVATLESQVAGLTTLQQQNLAAAQADAQNRADAGRAQTQADENLAAATDAMTQGVDMSVFGDFSEEAIARGVAELNRRAIEQAQTQMRAEMDSRLAKVEKIAAEQYARAEMTAQEAHEAAVLQVHPDAYDAVESAEFSAWHDSLPAFAKAGVEHAMSQGSAQEIIEVLNAFRESSGKPAPQQQQPTTPAAAPEAPKARVPNSLSEVPGSAPVDEMQQTLAAAGNSNALLDRMASMNPEQIDALLDRI